MKKFSLLFAMLITMVSGAWAGVDVCFLKGVSTGKYIGSSSGIAPADYGTVYTVKTGTDGKLGFCNTDGYMIYCGGSSTFSGNKDYPAYSYGYLYEVGSDNKGTKITSASELKYGSNYAFLEPSKQNSNLYYLTNTYSSSRYTGQVYGTGTTTAPNTIDLSGESNMNNLLWTLENPLANIEVNATYTLELNSSGLYATSEYAKSDRKMKQSATSENFILTGNATDGWKFQSETSSKYIGRCTADSYSTADNSATTWDIIPVGGVENTYYLYIHGETGENALGVDSQKAGEGIYTNKTASSTNCWRLTKVKDAPSVTYTVSYNLYYGETKVGETQTTTNLAEGAQFPTPKLPAYASVESGMPEGTVQADGEYNINITYDVPFQYAADAASISKWYTMKMHYNATYSRYIYNNGAGEQVAGTAELPVANTPYLWGFAGDPVNGFNVVAYNAEGKGISADIPAIIGTPATFKLFYATASGAKEAGWFCFSQDNGSTYMNWSSSKQAVKSWTSADEGSSIFVEEAEPVEAVTANMNIRAALGCATFCAPFEVAIPDGVKAYTTYDANTWVGLTEIEDGKIPAETPVVLYCKSDFNQNFTGAPSANTECTFGVLTGNIGTEKAPVATGKYLLQNNTQGTGWYEVTTSGLYIGVSRCVMNGVTPVNGGKARAYVPMAVGEATGINNISATAAKMSDGKYLVNGKIVVVSAGKAYNMNGQVVK